MGLDFEDDEVAPVTATQQGQRSVTLNSNSLTTPAPPGPVLPTDTMEDIHHKLKVATKNDRDAIYASAQEQDLLKKMVPVEALKEKYGNVPVPFIEGKDRVNLMARRVRAIHSDGDSIEIDFGAIKDGNRDDYLRKIGKLPPKKTAVEIRKAAAKGSITFDD